MVSYLFSNVNRLIIRFYEWDKCTPQDAGFDRMFLKNKFGDCNRYQHLVTYHVEENKVPLYRERPVGFVPMPFPWPPYNCEKQKSKSLKRKEVGE